MARSDNTTQFFITKLREGPTKKEPSALYHLDAEGVFTEGAAPTPDGKPAEVGLAARAKHLHADIIAASPADYVGIEVIKAALATAFPSVHGATSGKHRTTLARNARDVASYAVEQGWLVQKGGKSWKVGPITPPDVLPVDADDDFPTDDLLVASTPAAPLPSEPTDTHGPTVSLPTDAAVRAAAQLVLGRTVGGTLQRILAPFGVPDYTRLAPEQRRAFIAACETAVLS